MIKFFRSTFLECKYVKRVTKSLTISCYPFLSHLCLDLSSPGICILSGRGKREGLERVKVEGEMEVLSIRWIRVIFG